MKIQDLYQIAEQENIEVIPFSIPANASLSIMNDDGHCYIGIDPGMRDGGAQECVKIAHELGHCITGSFYNRHATVDSRQRHENRADKWAIQKLIPPNALNDAISNGCTEIWELAEKFGVTEDFVQKAICYYVHGNIATELYF